MIPSYLYINEAINERFEEEIPVQSDSFGWLQNIVLQRKFISLLHVYRTLEKLTTYINVFANFYESAVNYVSSVSKYLR